MYKLIKFSAIAGMAAITTSSVHYLLSVVEMPAIKLLIYSAVLTLAIYGVVLDDSIAAYFGGDNQAALAVIGIAATFIFLGGSYRAFCLGDNLQGILLAVVISVFWMVLLALYLQLLIRSKKQSW